MRDVSDLITDIASIVTSCKAGERMTLTKIEQCYRSIYNAPVPFNQFGYSSLEKLIENFPQYFQFSLADGCLIISTPTKNNITDLIANEKSRTRVTQNSTSIYKKHRKDMKLEPELPAAIIKQVIKFMEQVAEPIHKSEFLDRFYKYSGYEIKYQNYGFISTDHVFRYLGDIAVVIKYEMVHRRPSVDKSLFELVKDIISKDTGFTLALLQDRLASLATDSLVYLMQREGIVNFVDIVYICCSKKMVCYDFDLVYPFPFDPDLIRSKKNSDKEVRPKLPLYPPGVNHIYIHSVSSPSKFYFEIIDNESNYSRQLMHSNLQKVVANAPLLISFNENRICCVEYDGVWYRSRISDISVARGNEYVRVHFMDHPIQVGSGIEISLPTDRLRFLPKELEQVPAFFHRGSLAYVRPVADTTWSREAKDLFKYLVLSSEIRLEAYFVNQNALSVTVDIMTVSTTDDEKRSVFFQMLDEDLAELHCSE